MNCAGRLLVQSTLPFQYLVYIFSYQGDSVMVCIYIYACMYADAYVVYTSVYVYVPGHICMCIYIYI